MTRPGGSPFRRDAAAEMRARALAIRRQLDALRGELDTLEERAVAAEVHAGAKPAELAAPRFTLQLRQTAREVGISVAQLCGPFRARAMVVARDELYWLGAVHYGLSLPLIGRLMGNRDHTTVLHGKRRAMAALKAAGLADVEAMLALTPAERRAIMMAHFEATNGRSQDDQREGAGA
jgi:hypothetical protein